MKPKPKGNIVSARENLGRDVFSPERGKPRTKPLWIEGICRRDCGLSGGVPKLFINLQQVKLRTAAHHRIIKKLLIMLNEQANVAMDAVTVPPKTTSRES
jgi:hypothetical protein